MNVLLIYPEFPDTFWSFKHALKFVRKKAAFPPLGLLTVGAMLPEEWSSRLVDLNVTSLVGKNDRTLSSSLAQIQIVSVPFLSHTIFPQGVH